MKYLFCLFLSLCLLTSCSKEEVKQKVAEDLIIQIMVTGQWTVTSFTRGQTDVTTDFAPYKFQFQSNRSVDAIKNNTIEKTGSWEANATNRTITSNFINANPVLSLLNGTWTITNTTLTTVEANQTVNGEARTLKLNK